MIEHHVACWLGMYVNGTSVGLVCMRLWVQRNTFPERKSHAEAHLVRALGVSPSVHLRNMPFGGIRTE